MDVSGVSIRKGEIDTKESREKMAKLAQMEEETLNHLMDQSGLFSDIFELAKSLLGEITKIDEVF